MDKKQAKEYINKAYREVKRRRLKNKTPSLLTNNCTGGIMSHDLGLQFRSPTVNLWIPMGEFFLLLENLELYMAQEPEEIFEDGISYPIGVLRGEPGPVRLYFMHYASFQEAKEKWTQRKQRLQPDNLYVILECPGIGLSEEKARAIQDRFEALPYRHKKLLTGCSAIQGPDVEHLPVYENYRIGKLLSYKKPGLFSVKRYLDDFDYIKFLNS